MEQTSVVGNLRLRLEFAFTHGLGSHSRSDERTCPPRGEEPRGGCVSGERVSRGGAAGCGSSAAGPEFAFTTGVGPTLRFGRVWTGTSPCSPNGLAEIASTG